MTLAEYLPPDPGAPMLEFALDYARRGWPVFPCKPDKSPYIKGGLNAATSDEEKIRTWWQRWPRAMIGVPMGSRSGVWAVDPDPPKKPGDADGRVVWAGLLRQHGKLPPTHTESTPRGGQHVFFKWDDNRPVTNSPGALKGQSIDVRGEGGYVIVAPSVSADGACYSVVEPLDFFHFAMAPDWLYELILKKPEPTADRPTDFFRSVNSAALADLPAWVPSLFPGAKYQPGTKAFRVSSYMLGRDLEEDLSIAPNGIVDFGIHDMGDTRQGKRTAIDLVIDYGGAPDACAAAFWLCERLGRSRASFGWNEDDGRGNELAAQLLASAAEVHEDEPPPPPPSGTGISGYGDDWTAPEGLLAEMADWILASSRRPNRPLAVASAVSVLSAVCGRHLYAPTGTALNLYIVCLAATAVGKDRPLSAPGEILKAAGLGQLQTTAKGFSTTALEQMIIEHPCCVATVDEIGASLLARMSHKNSSTHEQGMRSVLLELWSRNQSKGPFETTRHGVQRGLKVPSTISIPRPNLTLFGVSTPESFYSAVTSGSVRDGFLNRFLLCHAAPRGKAQEVSEQDSEVPQSIALALQDLVPDLNHVGNLTGALGVFDLNVDLDSTVRRLGWDSDAVLERARAFEDEVLTVIDGDAETAPLMGRVFEYAIRLASLHAVSRAGRLATVTMDDLAWGISWSTQSAKALIDGAGNMMSSNEYEAKFNLIRNVVREAGQITRTDLLRKVRSIGARERDDIIRHLIEGGWIAEVQITSKGRTARGWRWGKT